MKCPTESEYVQRWPTPKSLLQGFSSFTRPLVELSRRKPAMWSLIFTGHISHIMSYQSYHVISCHINHIVSYHVIVIHYPCRCSLRAANGSVTLNCRARFNFTTCSLDKANWKQKHETHWNKSNQSTFHKCYSRSFTVYFGCFGLHCASNRIENDPSLKLSCWSSISDALTSTSSTPSASSSSLKVDLTAFHDIYSPHFSACYWHPYCNSPIRSLQIMSLQVVKNSWSGPSFLAGRLLTMVAIHK